MMQIQRPRYRMGPVGEDTVVNTSLDMTPQERSSLVKQIAGRHGFAACGVCLPDPIERKDYILAWLAAGRHGQMEYLQRNIDIRLDPRLLLAGARSVIVVGWLYRVRETDQGLPSGNAASILSEHSTAANDAAPSPSSGQAMAPTGRIARYAWGRDYHRVIRKRLQGLVDQLRGSVAVPFESRICVDTAPLLERELAQRAGVGWIGNNCLVLNGRLGSHFCLGAVITTLDLVPDEPAVDRCGTCDRCLKACPTGALVALKQMDSRKCISYHTIERRDDVAGQEPLDLAGQIYGCDICQQVCPYNGPQAVVSSDADAQARWPAGRVDLAEVLSWSEADWDAATKGRSLRRSTLAMWQRNAQMLLRRK